jgi:predicted ArsR family transcriptional regulator
MEARTRERLLHALKAAGPQSAAALARRLGVTAVAARQHLAALADEGLVAHDDVRAGVGRPRRLWSLSRKGHARFPDSHAALTLDLIEAARGAFGATGLDRMIGARERRMARLYGARLAGAADLGGKVRRLARLRSEEGYMAACRRDGAGYVLVENHCPICAAATACQGLCRSELALFREVLGPGVRVERVEHVLAGARRCAYRIAPEPTIRS